MSSTFAGLRDAGVPTRRVCVLVGRSRATHYRHAHPPLHGPAPARAAPGNAQALSAAERESVLAMISNPAYADLSIGQIWARELDADNYLCSASSMYRIARAAGQTRERRQATHTPPRSSPSCSLTALRMWTWDITKLRGPAKGIFYQLYVLIDIPPGSTRPGSSPGRGLPAGHRLHRRGHRTRRHRPAHRARRPRHLDGLQARLGAAGRPGRHPPQSRPHVSNDNPYSEAQFKGSQLINPRLSDSRAILVVLECRKGLKNH